MNDGYILLHRKIKSNPLWDDKPFSRGQAWIDMLMMANHEPHDVVLGSEIVHLERGQFIRTERALGEAWGWGRSKVRAFLKIIENLNQTRTKVEPKGNLITITNYDQYQSPNVDNKPKSNQKRTTSEPRANQEKECKKEIKEIYGQDSFQKFFWDHYPKHVKKARAFQEWQKTFDLAEHAGSFPIILERQKQVKAEKDARGQFAPEFPDPERWLKYRRWEDEVVETKRATQVQKIQCPSCKTQYGSQEAVNGQCPVCGGNQ